MRRAAYLGNGHTRNVLGAEERSPQYRTIRSLARARSTDKLLPLTSPLDLSWSTDMMLCWRTTSTLPVAPASALPHCSTFGVPTALECLGLGFIPGCRAPVFGRKCW